jgi:S1-C subfamily serine protease
MTGWLSILFTICCCIASAADVTLVDFRSDRCGPCRAMDPIVAELQQAGANVRIVNVEQEPQLTQRFRVGPIPCFVVLVGDQEAVRHVGPAKRSELENMLRIGHAAAQARSAPTSKPELTTPIQLVNQGSATRATNNSEKLIDLEPRSTNIARSLPHTKTTNTAARAQTLQEQLLESSVRVNITDSKGKGNGSGTVIDTRQGEALILTCGHIFRGWDQSSRLTVDFFGEHAAEKIPAKLLRFDEKADLGLISVTIQQPVRVAVVAPAQTKLKIGDAALATGCEGGEHVRGFLTRITQIDRYKDSFNLCIAGQPKQGRSGGGLFNIAGQVIGVCNAADAQDDEGIYASLRAIHQLLDESQLAFVYRRDESTTKLKDQSRALAQEPPAMAPNMPLTKLADHLRSPETSETINRDQLAPAQLTPPTTPNLNSKLNADYEVVCIIRPAQGDQAHGQVIHLNRASPEFMAYLAAEQRRTTTPTSAMSETARQPVTNLGLLPRPQLRRE